MRLSSSSSRGHLERATTSRSRGYSNNTGAYGLSVEAEPQTAPGPTPPADDHGDSRSDATSVDVNASAWGSIEVGDDVDFFSFNAVSGRSYTIETRLETLSDSVITLYDAGGSYIDDNDDISDSDLASRIEWTAPSSGTYYVRVEGYGDETGAYRLEISEGEQRPPPSVSAQAFASVSAGVWHTCGLRLDGSVECWGKDDYGQSTPPGGQSAISTAPR